MVHTNEVNFKVNLAVLKSQFTEDPELAIRRLAQLFVNNGNDIAEILSPVIKSIKIADENLVRSYLEELYTGFEISNIRLLSSGKTLRCELTGTRYFTSSCITDFKDTTEEPDEKHPKKRVCTNECADTDFLDIPGIEIVKI